MGFDEGVLQSDILRSALIPHRPSHVLTTSQRCPLNPGKSSILIQFSKAHDVGIPWGLELFEPIAKRKDASLPQGTAARACTK